MVIIRCERLISQLSNDKQTKIIISTFDQLWKSRSSKDSKYPGSSFRAINDSDISKKLRILAIQNENRATHNLELRKMKQKLEDVH